MAYVVQHAQVKNDVELSETGVGKLIKIHDPVIDLGMEPRMDIEKAGELDAIDRGYGSSVAFRFEAEPSVPRADIQQPLATQVIGNRELRIAPFLLRDGHEPVDEGTVRQLEAVIPALRGELFAEINPPAGVHYFRWRSRGGHCY